MSARRYPGTASCAHAQRRFAQHGPHADSAGLSLRCGRRTITTRGMHAEHRFRTERGDFAARSQRTTRAGRRNEEGVRPVPPAYRRAAAPGRQARKPGFPAPRQSARSRGPRSGGCRRQAGTIRAQRRCARNASASGSQPQTTAGCSVSAPNRSTTGSINRPARVASRSSGSLPCGRWARERRARVSSNSTSKVPPETGPARNPGPRKPLRARVLTTAVRRLIAEPVPARATEAQT